MAALPPGVTGDDLDAAFAKKHLAKKATKSTPGGNGAGAASRRLPPSKSKSGSNPARRSPSVETQTTQTGTATTPAPALAPKPNPAKMGPGGEVMTDATKPPTPPKDTDLGDVVSGGKVTPAEGAVELPVRLGQTESAAEAPYVSQLLAMLGPNGSNATSGLAQYLQSLPPAMAATIKSGIGNQMSALAGMAPAIQAQAQQAGDAGMLANMLAAAKYQAVYRQGQYGAPTGYGIQPGTSTAVLLPGYQPTPLGQLYQTVVGGGEGLSSSTPSPFIEPTSPKNKQQGLPSIPQ